MSWQVVFYPAFEAEFGLFEDRLQDELLAHALLLERFGPVLGRPTVDTLAGSKYKNLKELRFKWERQVWRVAFAFDPRRQAILLVAGDKQGTNERGFYERLIATAEKRLDEHLESLARNGSKNRS